MMLTVMLLMEAFTSPPAGAIQIDLSSSAMDKSIAAFCSAPPLASRIAMDGWTARCGENMRVSRQRLVDAWDAGPTSDSDRQLMINTVTEYSVGNAVKWNYAADAYFARRQLAMWKDGRMIPPVISDPSSYSRPGITTYCWTSVSKNYRHTVTFCSTR